MSDKYTLDSDGRVHGAAANYSLGVITEAQAHPNSLPGSLIETYAGMRQLENSGWQPGQDTRQAFMAEMPWNTAAGRKMDAGVNAFDAEARTLDPATAMKDTEHLLKQGIEATDGAFSAALTQIKSVGQEGTPEALMQKAIKDGAALSDALSKLPASQAVEQQQILSQLDRLPSNDPARKQLESRIDPSLKQAYQAVKADEVASAQVMDLAGNMGLAAADARQAHTAYADRLHVVGRYQDEQNERRAAGVPNMEATRAWAEIRLTVPNEQKQQ